MNKHALVRAAVFAALLCSLLGAAIPSAAGRAAGTAHARVPTAAGPVPKAQCGPGDHTEAGLQGETTVKERFGGDSEHAYNCNLQLVGQHTGQGAYSQDGPAYAGNCAYYGTDNDIPQQKHHGVTVIDASDPAHPRVTAYLDNTASALVPHETVQTSPRRHLLVVAQAGGPGFAVYNISDCRHPVLMANINLPRSKGHMGAFAPDGRTYYLTQSYRGVGGFLYIVDLSNPSHPRVLPRWRFEGNGRPHGLELNPAGFEPGVAEGTRLYAGQQGVANGVGTLAGPDGLVIENVSDYQNRRPHPQIRIISTLFWKDQGIAESMIPVKINGHPYLISTDEGGGASALGGLEAACDRGQSLWGFPQIIDVANERHPTIIAKLMLQVSDPANCQRQDHIPPDNCGGPCPGTNLPARSGSINYSEERCVANDPMNATMLACSFQNAGLRVFDIRDPRHPKEIAYYKPGAVRTAFRPSSGSWVPGADRTVDKVASWARWHKAGNDWELWFVSDGNGFQIVRFTNWFMAHNRSLFAG
jgi:LVIVD repeat-containing protein